MKNSNKIAGKNGEKSEDGAPCWWYCWGTAFRVQGAFIEKSLLIDYKRL
jgi:hypothetical protein